MLPFQFEKCFIFLSLVIFSATEHHKGMQHDFVYSWEKHRSDFPNARISFHALFDRDFDVGCFFIQLKNN